MNNISKHKIYLFETNYVEKNTANPVYKIGRTCQCHIKRFTSYPKDYDLVFLRCCVNSVVTEKNILHKFRSKYKVQHKNEYFSGNIQEMIKDINQIIDDEEKQITIPEIIEKHNNELNKNSSEIEINNNIPVSDLKGTICNKDYLEQCVF